MSNAFEPDDFGLLVLAIYFNADNVQPPIALPSFLREISVDGLVESRQFAKIHGVFRITVSVAHPGFDFDEKQFVVIFDNQINLAVASAEILIKSDVMAAAEKIFRQLFAVSAEFLAIALRHGRNYFLPGKYFWKAFLISDCCLA